MKGGRALALSAISTHPFETVPRAAFIVFFPSYSNRGVLVPVGGAEADGSLAEIALSSPSYPCPYASRIGVSKEKRFRLEIRASGRVYQWWPNQKRNEKGGA